MTQTSRLVVEIDSRDAEQKAADVRKALGALEDAGLKVKPAMDKAGTGLDGLGKASTKSKGSLDQLGQSMDKAGESTGRTAETADQASARLLEMAKSSLQASEYVKSLTASTTAVSSSFDAAGDKAASLAALSSRLRAESDALAGATDKAAAATKRSTAATDLQAGELSELLGKINPAVAALGRLDEQQAQLQKYKSAGLIDAETFRDYSTRIDASRKKLGDFDEGLRKTGVSSAQTQAALRQLPAQFTDIFTSLAGGQNPLMVLIQQGGQIKDSFGGVENTFDVLGSKIKGLFGIGSAAGGLSALAEGAKAAGIGAEAAGEGLGSMAEGANTAADASKNATEAAKALKTATTGAGIGIGTILGGTAVLAAGAALIAMFVDAEREVSKFNKALFSGTASSGQTVSSLTEIARSAAIITGSIGAAKDAVASLAGAAGLSETQFRNLALAATAISEFTGASAGEVSKALGDLGDNATKAAQKISAQYGLITSAQYDVIKALDDQGKKQEALDVLSATLTENAQARLKTYRSSLSDVERDWNDIGKAISNAYSNIRGELFPDSAKQIEIIERILKTRKEGGLAGAISNGLSQVNSALGLGSGKDDDSTENLEKRLAILKLSEVSRKESASVEGQSNRDNQDRIKADTEWSALAKSQWTEQKKLADDILQARRKGVEAGKSQAEIDKVVADIQAKYDKSLAKPKAYTEDAGMKALDQARQQFAVLQQQNALIGAQKGDVEKLGASGQALVKWEQELADIKGKQTLTADQKSLLANQELITAQLKRNAGLEKEIELRKTATEEVAKLSAFQTNQSSRLSTAQDGLNSSIEGIGLGSKARDRLKQDLAIQKDYARQSSELLEQRNTDRISPDLYAKENAVVQEGLASRLVMQQDYYNQQDTAQNDWLAGASSAWQNYFDIATDYNQQTQDATANLLGDTTSSLSDQIQGLVTGTVTLSDAFRSLGTTMASSVLGALSDIAAQFLVTQALKMAGITAETTAVVASEGIKTTAKVTGDAISTGSTLASLATTVAANVTAAATTMASWLPAALVASIGTFGAAAVVGGAGLLAAFALIKGFSDGGYTGSGGVNEPAGMVHKGEVVWSQADIRRSGGVSAVEAMRKGNVSAGVPISSGAGSKSASNGVPAQERPLVVNLHEDASRAGQVSRTQLSEQDVVEIYVSNISSEGQIHEANQSKYGLRSQGA